MCVHVIMYVLYANNVCMYVCTNLFNGSFRLHIYCSKQVAISATLKGGREGGGREQLL